MRQINKLRMLAGIPINTADEARKPEELTEAKQSSAIERFWVVVDPTENSEIVDIIWSDTPQKFSQSAVLGGHQSREYFEKYYGNVTFYLKETPAKKDAVERLAARDAKKKMSESTVTEATTLDKDEKKRVIDALQKTADSLEKQSSKETSRGQKAIYMRDAADYEDIAKACLMGDHPSARKQFAAMDTAARDAIFDAPFDKKTKATVAKYLGVDLLHETCGMKHSEDEEETSNGFVKGQTVTYKGEKHIVEVPNAKADFVGLIPSELKDASEEKRAAAVNLVHVGEIQADEKPNEPSGEDEETEVTLNFESEDKSKYNIRNTSGDNWAVFEKNNPVALISPTTKEKCVAWVKNKEGKASVSEAATDATVWDLPDDKDESPCSMPQDDRKITVPSKVKSELKKEIGELRKASKDLEKRDIDTSHTYVEIADAMEVILKCLEKGTNEGLKQAQIHMTKLMNPYIQRIPDVTYDFISRGGEPSTLKKLFTDVKVKKTSTKK